MKKYIAITIIAFILIMWDWWNIAYPASTVLSWQPPTKNEGNSLITDLDGYKIYYSQAEGLPTIINVGNVTTYELDNLAAGKTYCIYLTAYDTSGNESDFSEEKVYRTPTGTIIINGNMTIHEGLIIWPDGLLVIKK